MDTVIIKIYGPRKFQITNRSWFLPELIGRRYDDLSPTERQSVRPYLRRFVFRPPSQANYLPSVEVFESLTNDRKNIRYVLKAEFSVPKLLYGNSLQEAVETDRDDVFNRLRSSLASVGIGIDGPVIANARVAGVHLCKNIPLPKTIRIQEILNELARVDISKVVDITSTRFKNGGRVLNIYSGTIERSFYDKISDAMRPKNKRSDKGIISRERIIIERHKLQHQEVFRYEYRIKKTQTVWREVNAALGREYKTPVVFSDLFVPDLYKTMLLKSWRALIQRPENQLALLGRLDNLGLLLHIFSEAEKGDRSGHSMNSALVSYGLACAIRDHGAKEIRRTISKVWNTDHPERLTRKIKAAADLTRGLPYSSSIAFVDKALEDFYPISLASLTSLGGRIE